MNKEYQSLIQNNTWKLCDLPEGKKPIDSKWVFRTKRDISGVVTKYKARLVAKGTHKRKGLIIWKRFLQ